MLKVPELVEHYISHISRDPHTTVISFLKMHYVDTPVKDADYQQDMSLPFKCQDYSNVNFSVLALPKTFEFHLFEYIIPEAAIHNFAYSEACCPSVFLKIWQPPKV